MDTAPEENGKKVLTMAEYIEREALERSLNERLNRLFKLHGRHDHYVQGFDDCVGRVEEFPAADVAPVRHGRWEWCKDYDGDSILVCSECGRVCHEEDAPYCYCGCKMDLEG